MNYTEKGFSMYLQNGSSRFYAAVQPEMYVADTILHFTGTYYVYLLHPTEGSSTFILTPEKMHMDKWVPRDANLWVDDSIIEKLTQKIRDLKIAA